MTPARIVLFLLALAFASVVGLTIASMPGCAKTHTRTGGGHAATWENPRGAKYALSHQNQFNARISNARRDKDQGVRERSEISGRNGFDTERESEAIVQAVSVRFEQLANPNCKRQRSLRSSPRGLNGAECARLSSSASVSTPTRDRSRHPASAILNSAGGGGPKAPGYGNDCRPSQRTDYARERTSEANFVDPGSIPGGYTKQQARAS